MGLIGSLLSASPLGMLMSLFQPGLSPEMSAMRDSVNADNAAFMTEAQNYLNPDAAIQ